MNSEEKKEPKLSWFSPIPQGSIVTERRFLTQEEIEKDRKEELERSMQWYKGQ